MKTLVFASVLVSCTGAPKIGETRLAGGSSEETNAITVAQAPLSLDLPQVFQGRHSYRVWPDSLDLTSGASDLAVSAKVLLGTDSTGDSEDSMNSKTSMNNLFGKLANGPDSAQSVFSLALVENACGTSGKRFAFFFTDGSGALACPNALVSDLEAPAASWVALRVTWSAGTLSLYQNGALAGRRSTALEAIPASVAPFYLGLSDARFSIDSLSFSTEAPHELP
jgi:hypothetical protein